MNIFRKLHPDHWGVRTWVVVILTIGAIGLLGGGR